MHPNNTANVIHPLETVAHYLRSHDIPAATALAEATHSARPGDADTVNMLAVCYIRAGEFVKAIEVLSAQLRITPDRAELHANLAYALEKTGALDSAIHHVNLALSQWRSDPNILVLAARLSMKNGDYQKATQFVSNALIIDPQNAEANTLRGHIHFRFSHFGDAIHAYRLGLKLNPDDATCRLNLALAILGDGVERALLQSQTNPSIDKEDQ